MTNKDRNEIYEELVENNNLPPVIMRGNLYFTIGLPRSGKSTFANRWQRSALGPRVVDRVVFPRVIVRADDIRLAVTGERFNSRAEPTVHMVKDYMIEALLAGGHDVLVDGTHTTKASIRRLLQIDSKASYTYIPTETWRCVERAIATNQEDLVPIIERMGKQLSSLLSTGISQVCEEIRQEIKGYGVHRIA